MTVSASSRTVTVTGPRGTLTRAFKTVNFAVELRGTRSMRVDMWFGNRKQKACLRTVCTHMKNMMTGVTEGFSYKVRYAYNHFPINVTLTKDKAGGDLVEVRNFLGERQLRKVKLYDDVKISKSDNVKDELVLVGNDIEKVAGSAALLHESCLVKGKDIRKFLVRRLARRRQQLRARGEKGAGKTRALPPLRSCITLSPLLPPPSFPPPPARRTACTSPRRGRRTTSSRSSNNRRAAGRERGVSPLHVSSGRRRP